MLPIQTNLLGHTFTLYVHYSASFFTFHFYVRKVGFPSNNIETWIFYNMICNIKDLQNHKTYIFPSSSTIIDPCLLQT